VSLVRIVLIDLTAGATTRDGGSLTPAILASFANAYTKQLNTHYSAEYGGNFEVRAGTDQGDLHAGEYPFVWLPQFTDVPGAIAYHTVNGNGMPLLFDAITASATINGPGNSSAIAGSHECLETARDPAINLWADDGASTEHAAEVGDPFENQSYEIDGVSVSNFALQSWFTPHASGPYSYMAQAGLGSLDAPGPLIVPAGQGYQVTRVFDPNSEQSVNGFRVQVVGEMRRRPHAHEHSRKHRRGART
jgi:hypothetical protein